MPINKEDVEHVAKSIDNEDIAKNDYNLLVSEYVEPKSDLVKSIIENKNIVHDMKMEYIKDFTEVFDEESKNR